MKRKIAICMSLCIAVSQPITIFANTSTGIEKQTNRDLLITDLETELKEDIEMIKGETVLLKAPENFVGKIEWYSTTGFLTSGASKKKYPLAQNETDGNREYGLASANHLINIENGNISAKEKGNDIKIVAKDKNGKTKVWNVDIKAYKEEDLPTVTKEDYKHLRSKYVEELVGEENDLSDKDIANFVNNIDKNAQKWWDSYKYKKEDKCEGIPWDSDLEYKGKKYTLEEYKKDAVLFRVTYQHTEAMAKAYATPNGKFYKNPELLKDITEIMDWLTENCYYPRSQTDNWWTWEIGLPKNVIPICLYIYDDLEKSKAGNYIKAIEIMQPDPFFSGAIGTASTHATGYRANTSANLMDCAQGAIGLGLILEDSEYLTLASKAASSTMTGFQQPKIENGRVLYANGFYEDGAYIDHERVPYVGSYGIEMLKGATNLITLLANTPWQLNQENTEMLQKYIIDGYIPAIYNGLVLDMYRGRAIARPNLSDKIAGEDMATMLLKLTDAVDKETGDFIKANIKYWISKHNDYLIKSKDLSVLRKVKEIIKDDTIDITLAQKTDQKIYSTMDRVVKRNKDYLFGISMYSNRIQNTEIMNDENLNGWFTGFGMTYLYNNDTSHYTDNYWNTVNPYKLPGTTIVPINIGNGKPDSTGFHQGGDFLSPETWVGGTSLEKYIASGMSLSGIMINNGDPSNPANDEYANDLKAKKSYFMLEDEIVCLGAGIENKNKEGIATITTIENRKIKDDASNKVIVDGNEINLESTQTIAPTWVYLEGNTKENSNIGYYFPEQQEMKISKVSNTGSFADIKGDLNKKDYPDVTKKYLEMILEHGVNPQEETYSYFILPNKMPEQLENYAKEPKAIIISNTKEVQAVRYNNQYINKNVLLANFWEDKETKVEHISCDKKASVILQEENSILKIAVSDPTMLNNDKITLIIEDINPKEVLSKDSNVLVEIKDNNAIITVNTKELFGKTSNASISLK